MSDIQANSVVQVEHRGQVKNGIIDTVDPVENSFDLLRVVLQVDGQFRKNELFHMVSDGEKYRARVLEIWTQWDIQKLVVQIEIPER